MPGQDTLILVGDLVNKGPKSAETVRWCREHSALSVRGNHEDACLERVAAHRAGEAVGAAYAYVRDLDDADVAYLEGLPHTLALADVGAIVVHAGLAPNRALEDQDPTHMVHMRSLDAAGTPSRSPGAASWAASREEDPHVVFGHDARRGLQRHPRATGLDTGCAYGKKLTGLRLPEKTFVAVDAKRVYSAPGGDSPKKKNKGKEAGAGAPKKA